MEICPSVWFIVVFIVLYFHLYVFHHFGYFGLMWYKIRS
jgi:capsule polysaccharide export protein KpsE/RkpR